MIPVIDAIAGSKDTLRDLEDDFTISQKTL
jgi:hypothetical protein